MEGYQTLRQLGFGLLDMAYHTEVGALENKSVKAFEVEKTAATNLYPSNPETAASPSFRIFSKAVIRRVIILTNGLRFWMRMLSSISKKMEFLILILRRNIKFFFLLVELKIQWNCTKISVEENLKSELTEKSFWISFSVREF
jgi:peptidyl-dipeptidase Dcp